MSLKLSATYRIQTQTPQLILNLAFKKARGRSLSLNLRPRDLQQAFPLGMVLEACPDIVDYAKGGISNWRDFQATAAVVRSMLGISPSAWEAAQSVMGESPPRSSSPRSCNAARRSPAPAAISGN